MEIKRPRLDNPQEFALIKSIYFYKDNFITEEIDKLEQLKRQESRQKYNNKSSR